MKISQLRSVLEHSSQIYEHSGDTEMSRLLLRLSAAIKPADKDDVKKFIERLATLRKSEEDQRK